MLELTAYAIPPLVSALFLASLGVVTLVSTGHARPWVVFASFCFIMAIGSFMGFLIETSNDVGVVFDYVRVQTFLLVISLSFANFYAMDLTGFRFGITKHSHLRFVRNIVTTFLVIWAAILVMLFKTRWMISAVDVLPDGGFKLAYGPVMWAVLGLFFVGTVRNLVFLVHAYRKTSDRIFREFVGLNLLAFHTIFAPAIWLLFILPVYGLPTQVLAFLAFPVAVMMFYIAIVRFQYARVRELNVSLEQKVEERTRELKQTQGRLAQSERMASLGQLVAGVAHEMNNPVAAVRSMAASVTTATKKLRGQVPGGASDEEKLERIFGVLENAGSVIEEGTRKITDVVDNLKSFARLDESDLQRTDINKELGEAAGLLEHVLSPGVSVKKELGDVPEVMCYPAKLNQVFLNLLLNADEAMGGEGTVVVATESGQGVVRIGFNDTGRGVPAQHLDRVFEPGFTTKGRGVGTGLGLAICYQIIRDHDGEIRLASDEGEGTTVTIELPVNGPERRD